VRSIDPSNPPEGFDLRRVTAFPDMCDYERLPGRVEAGEQPVEGLEK
jgi:hypothetical protein